MNECSPPETGCATRCEPPQAEVLRTSQRQRQTGAASPRPEGSGLGVALPRGGGYGAGEGPVRGSQGGVHPRRIFRQIFLADFSFAFCDQKNPPQNRGEFLFQKSPGLEAPKIHRPPPPRESKSKSCALGSGTVTFQGGSFQEMTPGLIGPRNLRILIGRIAVGWPCMECHVLCHISIHWVWDSVKQSEGWGRNTALIARSPTRHSKNSIEIFITNRLCWFGSLSMKLHSDNEQPATRDWH